MRILFNSYFSSKTSAQGIMINETVRALRELHEVGLAQLGRLVESNRLVEVRRSGLRKRIGRYLNDPRRFVGNFGMIRLERRLLEYYAPDIVINLCSYLSFSMPLLAKVLKIPSVVFMDSPVVYETKHVDKEHLHFPLVPEFIEEKILQSSDAVISITHDLKDFLCWKYDIDSKKIHVILNGVDTDRFRVLGKAPEVISRLKLDGKVVVGFCGIFKKWNMDEVMEIISLVTGRESKVVFLLVGDGPKKPDVMNFIKARGLSNVVVTGYVTPERVPEYVSVMDIAIAPYTLQGDFFYGCPMKVFEYMACGKAVVTSSFGAMKAVIKDGFDGFLIEPGNNEAFAERVVNLIEDRTLCSLIGERARRRVVDNFTWMHRARAMSEVCESVLKGRGSR
jgi:glycosyltransferase involved in cell wall biosynthesis